MSLAPIAESNPQWGVLVALKKRRRLLFALAATGIGVAVMWTEFSISMDRAIARVESGSEIVSTKSGAVEYADAGIGAPLLMIHGSGGGFDQGLDFSRRLIDGGFRVIAPSRFGYLRSSMPANASPRAQADAFAELLDHLKLDRVPVIAGSAGAPSAVEFAIHYPERCSALVLLVPLGYVPGAAYAPEEATSPAVRSFLESDFLFWLGVTTVPDLMIGSLLATDPQLLRGANVSEQERVRRVLAGVLPVSRRSEGLLSDSQLAQSLKPVALDRIEAPVLAISLEDDRYNTVPAASHIVANVRNGRLIVYPTGGHLWVGHDAKIFDEITDFVREPAQQALVGSK
jgi:2-hydroxy-6-oxonona-2,4-dienedioate hydrolase